MGRVRPIGFAHVFAALVMVSSLEASAESKQLPPPYVFAYGENETPRSLAMGGAVRALGNGTTALFANPANMALSRLYHVEAIGQFTPEATRALGGASIVDSITSSTNIAGGMSLIGGLVDPDGLDRSYVDTRINAALPLGDRFFLGAGARYMRMIQDGFGLLDDRAAKTYSAVSGGLVESGKRKPLVDTITFDIGATLRITESVHLGVVGQNLTHPGNSFLPTTLGAGLGYGTKDISLEADGVADFDSWDKTTYRLMVGGEYLAGDHYPIRLGYRFDQGANVHAVSGGFGYVGTEFAAEISVRRTISTTINATMIGLALTYHLESSGLTRTRVSSPE